jgi:VWFA-related protein
MTARSTAPAILALVAAATLAFPTAAQRETRSRDVLVSVTDKNDAPVSGLTVKDFSVREDGVAREVLKVAPAAAPMQLALLGDDSQALGPQVAEMRTGLGDFVKQIQQASPETDISIYSFGERSTVLAPFTTDAAVLQKAVDRFFPRAGGGAYMLDAILDAAKALKKRAAPRGVIVAFTIEGGVEFGSATSQQIEKALKDANASLWTIVLQGRSPQPSADEERERQLVLHDVATNSGGANKTVLSRVGIGAGFSWVAAALTHAYDVTYSRPDTLIPPTKLDVRATAPGSTTWAPHWAHE